MTNEGKKPPDGSDEPHATAEQGLSAADQVDTDTTMQTNRGTSEHDTGGEAMIDRRIQNHLGWKLKESYDDLVRQPVPDKFHKLLEELERKEKKQ